MGEQEFHHTKLKYRSCLNTGESRCYVKVRNRASMQGQSNHFFPDIYQMKASQLCDRMTFTVIKIVL